MSDSNHPLYDSSHGQHPLSDPPEKPKGDPNRGQVRVRFPGAVDTPMLTYALLALNVGIFALRYIVPDFAWSLIMWGVADTDLVLRGGQYYRLFTAMFLHFNEVHMLFNGIALYYIGANVERIFGSLRFGLIYLLGGLLGSVAMLFVGTGGLGASGAVFAIWGAEAVFLYQHRQLFGAMARSRLQNSVMLMIVNFMAAFTANTVNELAATSSVRISNAAHFGGLVGGALLTWLVGPRFAVPDNPQVTPDKPYIDLLQANPLRERVRDILFYLAGLAALILLAVVFRT